ncbi:unnamed protein product [Blepharisma stoltei]|uniref:PH domain-containing protein n=1 Tax=Blepharisma stoltei TaxID=1481888 RepID=A0AAU9JBS0_9CILI|nr:unnamed protein product [Blepharisma stoltei]
MSESFKPLHFDALNVGKMIKRTKRKYTWKFELDGIVYTLNFYVSKLSGKRKILLNGEIKLNTKNTTNFSIYPVKIYSHKLYIYQIGDNQYDLRCENLSFDDLLKGFDLPGLKSCRSISSRQSLFNYSNTLEVAQSWQENSGTILYEESKEEPNWEARKQSYVTPYRLPRLSLQNPTRKEERDIYEDQKRFKRGPGPSHVMTDESFDDYIPKDSRENAFNSKHNNVHAKNPFETAEEASKSPEQKTKENSEIDLLDVNVLNEPKTNEKSFDSVETLNFGNGLFSYEDKSSPAVNASMQQGPFANQMAPMMAYNPFMTGFMMGQYQTPNQFQKSS